MRAILIAPNASAQINGDFRESTGFVDDANFEDELATFFPNLPVTNLYGTWYYRICPVDLLGNEQGCTANAPVRARELHSPAVPTGQPGLVQQTGDRIAGNFMAHFGRIEFLPGHCRDYAQSAGQHQSGRSKSRRAQ